MTALRLAGTAPSPRRARSEAAAPSVQVAAQVIHDRRVVLWILPILFALYVALRPYRETRSTATCRCRTA